MVSGKKARAFKIFVDEEPVTTASPTANGINDDENVTLISMQAHDPFILGRLHDPFSDEDTHHKKRRMRPSSEEMLEDLSVEFDYAPTTAAPRIKTGPPNRINAHSYPLPKAPRDDFAAGGYEATLPNKPVKSTPFNPRIKIVFPPPPIPSYLPVPKGGFTRGGVENVPGVAKPKKLQHTILRWRRYKSSVGFPPIKFPLAQLPRSRLPRLKKNMFKESKKDQVDVPEQNKPQGQGQKATKTLRQVGHLKVSREQYTIKESVVPKVQGGNTSRYESSNASNPVVDSVKRISKRRHRNLTPLRGNRLC